MPANIYAGYMGIANFDYAPMTVRFNDCSLNARQVIEAPDLVMGDMDHDAYVFGKVEVGGTMSGPVTETFIDAGGSHSLWEFALERNIHTGQLVNTSGINITYYDGRSRTFEGMLCNNIGFSCAAGDIANFTMDLLGTKASVWDAVNTHRGGEKTDAEKLITWDRVTVGITGTSPGAADISNESVVQVPYSNIDFTISNNCTAVYAMTPRPTESEVDLFPYQIVTGIRTITGTLSIYNTTAAASGTTGGGVTSWDEYLASNVATLTVTLGGAGTVLTIPMFVQFHRPETASAVSPVTTTVGFTGVTHQTGFPEQLLP